MKDGKIDRYFQVKGLIVSDPYKMLNIQCMSSTRMQEKLAHLANVTVSEESDEELNTSL